MIIIGMIVVAAVVKRYNTEKAEERAAANAVAMTVLLAGLMVVFLVVTDGPTRVVT